MKLFLQIDPKVIAEAQAAPLAPKILDEIDALADSIQANMGKEVSVPKDVLDSFKLKDSLNQDIWTNGHLNPKVRTKLIRVAEGFIKDLELDKAVKVKDIIFTGSLANFNWSKFSDIDLHIVLDFDQFDAEPKFVEDYFYAQKSLWNQEHDIKIFGYPIELYVQNLNDNLVATAIYSVLNDKWVKKPKRENFEIDEKAIKDKADKIIYNLRDIRQDYNDKNYQSVVDKVTKLKNKIKQMRNAGLEKGGELSLENLVFKVLRRTPFMDQLDSYKAKAYDKLMSVSEVDETINIPYNDKAELKTKSYSSLSNPNRSLNINAIKFRIAKAAQEASLYTKENPDNHYFNSPLEGDGFYQVEFRHDGQIKTKHVKASGDMEQKNGAFQPSDLGTCKTFQNIAKYCFVKAGIHHTSVGSSPAEDAANKALIIFKDEILSFFGDSGYDDEKAAQISKEKMSDKQASHKMKKDLESKIGRRLSDTEWNEFQKNGIVPKGKPTIKQDPQKIADFEKKQALLKAKLDAIKAKKR